MSPAQSIKEDIVQEQILQAAKQLFQQHGLQKVTMDDVARAVGKGRSSLYYYYKNKDEIFDAVMDIEIGRIVAEMTRAMDEAPGIEGKLYAFYASKLNVIGKRRSIFKTIEAGMDAEAMSNFTKAKDAIHQRLFKLESALLRQILGEGIRNGELKPMGESQLESLVFVLVSTLHGLKRELLGEDDPARLDPILRELARMAIHGLAR